MLKLKNNLKHYFFLIRYYPILVGGGTHVVKVTSSEIRLQFTNGETETQIK